MSIRQFLSQVVQFTLANVSDGFCSNRCINPRIGWIRGPEVKGVYQDQRSMLCVGQLSGKVGSLVCTRREIGSNNDGFHTETKLWVR